MRTLVFGRNGQLGRALFQTLSKCTDTIFIGRNECNLFYPAQIENCLNYYNPNIIINASAYTQVDRAEVDHEPAFAINEFAVGVMAKYCKVNSAKLVHFSTDYVFDGKKNTPYSENDVCRPINVYGKSKHNGEKVIQNILGNDLSADNNYMVIRTSWMYGDGENFIRSILNSSKVNKNLRVISDQFGVPTSATWLAEIAKILIYSKNIPSGVYHAVPPGKTSWYDLANHVIRCARKYLAKESLVTEKVLPILSCNYSLPARRPSNSCLSTAKIQNNFEILNNFFKVNWEDQVELYISEIINHGLS